MSIGQQLRDVKTGLPYPVAFSMVKPRSSQQVFPIRSIVNRTFAQLLLPRSLRRDPLSTPPPISPADAKRGLLHLLTAGLIPRNADMTPALAGESGVIQQKTMAMHEYGQQFVQSFVSTFTPPSNLVLDLHTPVHGAVHGSIMVNTASS